MGSHSVTCHPAEVTFPQYPTVTCTPGSRRLRQALKLRPDMAKFSRGGMCGLCLEVIRWSGRQSASSTGFGQHLAVAVRYTNETKRVMDDTN